MADNREPTESTALERVVRGVIGGMCFCRPGFIESFDVNTQLVRVTPAIMMKASIDGKVEYKKLPILINVPISLFYAQTLGLIMTLPITKGDECTLIFSDRALDNFIEQGAQGGNAKPEVCGGNNQTSEPRMHDLVDGICIPGIITKPFRIPNYNPDAMEMRTRDGKNYIRLGSNDYGLRFTTGGGFDEGGSDIRMKDGKIWFYAAEEISERTKKKWSEQPPIATGGTREPTMPD